MDIDHAPSTRYQSTLFLVFVAELAEFDHDGLSDARNDTDGSRRSTTIRHTICQQLTLEGGASERYKELLMDPLCVVLDCTTSIESTNDPDEISFGVRMLDAGATRWNELMILPRHTRTSSVENL